MAVLARDGHRLRPIEVAALVASQGRRAVGSPADGARILHFPAGPYELVRADRDGVIQAVRLRGLVAFGRRHDCLVVLRHGVGDFVTKGMPLAEVRGAPEQAGRRLLLRVIGARLDGLTGGWVDRTGRVRLLLPVRRWPDYLELAVTEIAIYGATSPQVPRRLVALLTALREEVPCEGRAAVDAQLEQLAAMVRRRNAVPYERDLLLRRDRQGLGGRRPSAPMSPRRGEARAEGRAGQCGLWREQSPSRPRPSRTGRALTTVGALPRATVYGTLAGDMGAIGALTDAAAILDGKAGTIVTPGGDYGGPNDLRPQA